MSRLLDAMRFVEENAGERTHPLGCMAVTGYDDTPDGIAWLVRICQCPYDHPRTNAELTEQYAAEGWVNIDALPTPEASR